MKTKRMHPYLWRFWTRLPANGQIAIFDRSWYRRVQIDHFDTARIRASAGTDLSGDQLL